VIDFYGKRNFKKQLTFAFMWYRMATSNGKGIDNMINVNNTTKSYSGRPGCMCGCNGKYNESPRARKMAITQLTKNPEVRLLVWNNHTEGCIHVENETRSRVLYLNAYGVAEARVMAIKEEE